LESLEGIRHSMNNFLSLAFGLTCSVASAMAYGPPGHTLVGDIATSRLDGATAAKIHALVGNLSLGFMARLPDDIKGWDPGARPYAGSTADLAQLEAPDFTALNAALHAYHDANSAFTPDSPTERLHAQFHFTDVPVKDPEKYADGPTGRRPTDLVHMIRFCAQVLHGDIPEDNRYKITRPIAIILLAHLVGDIHQPLHVGAEYFNAAGQKANPDAQKGETDYPDEGGNSILVGRIEGLSAGARALRFHGIWDSQFVDAAKRQIRAETGKAAMSEKELVRYYLSHPPANWALPAGVSFADWPVAWADQILPIAREAHERLQFTNLKPSQYRGAWEEHATASEFPGGHYYQWAGQTVKLELGLAGFRLAALLQAALN
jgi:hypothetical protein